MIQFTILGAPKSKANGRKVVTIAGHSALVKSKDALAYERDALRQIPPKARARLEGPVCVTLRIWYETERPDLDESLVLDILADRFKGKGEDRKLVQHGVYRNDRQVREKHVFHGIDKRNPRTVVQVEPMQAQQIAMALPEPVEERFAGAAF